MGRNDISSRQSASGEHTNIWRERLLVVTAVYVAVFYTLHALFRRSLVSPTPNRLPHPPNRSSICWGLIHSCADVCQIPFPAPMFCWFFADSNKVRGTRSRTTRGIWNIDSYGKGYPPNPPRPSRPKVLDRYPRWARQ